MTVWQTGHTFLSSERIVLSKSNIAEDAGALVVADVDATIGSSGGDDAGALVVGDVADGDATIGSSGGDDAGCGIEDKLLGGS